MKYCEYGSGVSATSVFAMEFRLDPALSNVYKDFRNRWRLKAKARIFHRVMRWLRLESGSHLFQCPAQEGSHTALL